MNRITVSLFSLFLLTAATVKSSDVFWGLRAASAVKSAQDFMLDEKVKEHCATYEKNKRRLEQYHLKTCMEGVDVRSQERDDCLIKFDLMMRLFSSCQKRALEKASNSCPKESVDNLAKELNECVLDRSRRAKDVALLFRQDLRK
jgi:hypothetical protein